MGDIVGVSPRTGLLSSAALSSGLPSSCVPSSGPPSSIASSRRPTVPSTVAASTRSHPTDKPHSHPPSGGVKVLPTGPVPISPSKTPKTPASSHISSTSEHTVNPNPRVKVPTPAPSVKPHATISPVLSKAKKPTPNSKPRPLHHMKPGPATNPLECHISVDDRPDIPLKARLPKNVDGSKWLNHRPLENFEEGNYRLFYSLSLPYSFKRSRNKLGCLYPYCSGDLLPYLVDIYCGTGLPKLLSLLLF